MRHIPAYCPDFIMSARPGDTLAACDWKELVFLGDAKFAIYQRNKARAVRKRGFAQARDFYNSLSYPEPNSKKHAYDA